MMMVMRAHSLLGLMAMSLMLSGCLAKTAASIVTAPVRVGSKAVDVATTSQSEADEARGREIRRREERLGKLEREYSKLSDECEDGDRRACEEAREVYDEIQEILPTVPYEPS